MERNTSTFLNTYNFSLYSYTNSSTLSMDISSQLINLGINKDTLTTDNLQVNYDTFAFQSQHSSESKIGGISDTTKTITPTVSYNSASGIIYLQNAINRYSADGGYYYIYPKFLYHHFPLILK